VIVETLLGIHDVTNNQAVTDTTMTTPAGFLHRVGKSIKSLFGCAEKQSRLDLDETSSTVSGGSSTGTGEHELHTDHRHHSNHKIQYAHSWVTQQHQLSSVHGSLNLIPVHQSLVIDLPPALNKVLII
jgi:hypothetical protein